MPYVDKTETEWLSTPGGSEELGRVRLVINGLFRPKTSVERAQNLTCPVL